ncbi:hypothetical protein U6N30_22295 [Blastococcus brunescens]|uniref:Uncharacterized protein n=1 Tax=Blastococcus brunescens TaxID=1564165 RepID=A0ABZ1AVR2_9ACTN|nr:hypothetical protein [Blastococcus sp. BMG 8361]WRL62653.1 hypothetical protein U6N30_22295 [Blastococcus sp. BMG 8361]
MPEPEPDGWVAWQKRSEIRSWSAIGCGQTAQEEAVATGAGARATDGAEDMGRPD